MVVAGSMLMPFAMFGRAPVAGLAFIATFGTACAMWMFEANLADRLAFMSLLPQRVEAKWLVLAPICVLGFLPAIVDVALGRPLISALPFIGIAWWAAASTRWLTRVRFWYLLGLPVLLLAPAAAYGAHKVGGWGAAAAVAMGFGGGALAFQPRAPVGESMARLMEGNGGRAVVRTRAAPRSASLAARGRADGFAAAVRFMQLSIPLFWAYATIGCAMAVLLGLIPILGRASQVFVSFVIFVPVRQVGAAYSGDMQEFLGPLPFKRWPRFVGGVLFTLSMMLLAPALALCFVNLDWVERGGILGLFSPDPPKADAIRYLREVLGATFMPDKWPAGGLPPDLWAQLRPLLYLDILRAALLIVALLFGMAVIRRAEARPGFEAALFPNLALLGIVFAIITRDAGLSAKLPVAPLWFVALVALAAIGHWAWRVRVVNAPTRAQR